MDTYATNVIRTLGGTSEVSRLAETPTSTVHSWKHNGIPAWRLPHLKLVAKAARKPIDWATGLPPVSDAAKSEAA